MASKAVLFFSFLLLSSLFFSCESGTKVRPLSYGKLDNVLVVSNNYIWQETAGDSLRAKLAALYPITPQPEPRLDLRHERPDSLDKVLKTRRVIVILSDLLDTADFGRKLTVQALGEKGLEKALKQENFHLAFQKDRWAEGQLVIYWFAAGYPALIKSISNDYPTVLQRIGEVEDKQLKRQLYFSGEDEELGQEIAQHFGFRLRMPKGYLRAHKDSATMWFRYETNKISSNIFLSVLPDTTISEDFFKAKRNELSQKYFASRIEGSFMQIDDRFVPVFFDDFSLGKKGMNGLQARGLWYIVNDFMGGSFVSYLFRDPERKRLILLDAFVHAPGQAKRPELRKLDAVLSSFALSN